MRLGSDFLMENVVGALNGVPGDVDDYSERTTSRLVDCEAMMMVRVVGTCTVSLHVLDHVRVTGLVNVTEVDVIDTLPTNS